MCQDVSSTESRSMFFAESIPNIHLKKKEMHKPKNETEGPCMSNRELSR